MSSLNQVTLMGNLTRDPELRHTSGGKEVCNFGLAVNDDFNKDNPPMFIDVTTWGKTATNCADYLRKGRPVLLIGRLKLDQWEKDGQKRSRHTVTADRVVFLGSGKAHTDPARDDDRVPEVGSEDDMPF